jgi:hypothetical protein
MALSEWKNIIGYEEYYKIRLYDNEFGCEIMSLKFRNPSGKYSYRERLMKPSINYCGYYRIKLTKDGECEKFRLHRLIAQYFIPNPDNLEQVDHIDNNRLNNNIKNLRWVTRSQNIQNRKKKQNCSSKYIGVNLDKYAKKWKAQIYVNGKKLHLGLFKNEEDAAKIYDLKADEINHFGPRNFTNQ